MQSTLFFLACLVEKAVIKVSIDRSRGVAQPHPSPLRRSTGKGGKWKKIGRKLAPLTHYDLAEYLDIILMVTFILQSPSLTYL